MIVVEVVVFCYHTNTIIGFIAQYYPSPILTKYMYVHIVVDTSTSRRLLIFVES